MNKNESSERRSLEELINYSAGWFAFNQRIGQVKHRYDQDHIMETINWNYNNFLLYVNQPEASFCEGILDSLKFFEDTRFLPN